MGSRGRIDLRILVRYKLDADGGSDAVEEILLALRKALPQTRGQAVLCSFVAHIRHGVSVADEDDDAQIRSVGGARGKRDR